MEGISVSKVERRNVSQKVLGITAREQHRPPDLEDQREVAAHELGAEQKLGGVRAQPHGGSNSQACG